MARCRGNRLDGERCMITRGLDSRSYCWHHLPRCQGFKIGTRVPCKKRSKVDYDYCCAAHDLSTVRIAPSVLDPIGFKLRDKVQRKVVKHWGKQDPYNQEPLDLKTPYALDLDHIGEKQIFTYALVNIGLPVGDENLALAIDVIRDEVVNHTDNLALTRPSTNRIKGQAVWYFLDDERTGHRDNKSLTDYLLGEEREGDKLTRTVTGRITREMGRTLKRSQWMLSDQGDTPVLERLSEELQNLYKSKIVVVFSILRGLSSNAIYVDIDENKTLRDPKEVVKAKHRRLKSVNVDDIPIFAARIAEGEWMSLKQFDDLLDEFLAGVVPIEVHNIINTTSPLDPSEKINCAFDELNVLHALLDVRGLLPPPERPLTWYIGIDEKHREAFRPYWENAHRVPQEMSKKLDTVIKNKVTALPNIVLRENAPGIATVQMAFDLQASGRWDVIHILCSPPEEWNEPFHKALETRSRAFRWCQEQDLPLLQTVERDPLAFGWVLHIHSFIRAVLMGDVSFYDMATRMDVKDAIRIHENAKAKPYVFFLDGYELKNASALPRSDEKGEILYECDANEWMLNVFMSFGLAVVVAPPKEKVAV